MVGQRFVDLLFNHPWFEIVCIAASRKSAGKFYKDAVKDRWAIESEIPQQVKRMRVRSVVDDLETTAGEVDLVFCALDMDKEEIKKIEVAYANEGVPVVSNNSAHRWSDDVPMIMPEINPGHLKLIDIQRKNRGWKKGLIVVKPNCSIQSYVSILTALRRFNPLKVHVVSLQAISGAGKTFESWPEMIDNVIPFISVEEEKSEKEPLKIWGEVKNNKIILAQQPQISATCIRIPVSDGHMASVSVSFKEKPSKEEIISSIKKFQNPIESLRLPSALKQFIKYFEQDNRPQTRLDRNFERGMGIAMGRLQEDEHFDWRFIALSHNTIRGAAGGAILTAELLVKKGYI
jgi:aspartate-semialdehyde dehydrogenase